MSPLEFGLIFSYSGLSSSEKYSQDIPQKSLKIENGLIKMNGRIIPIYAKALMVYLQLSDKKTLIQNSLQ